MSNGIAPGYHEVTNQETGETQLRCDECGDLRVAGDWPYCKPSGHSRPTTRFGDDPIEPYIDENVDGEPQEITTRGQRRAFMRRNNLEYKPKRTDLLPSTKRYFFT